MRKLGDVEKERGMSTTGLEVFDTTVQKTNIWLKDIMQALGWEDRHKAYVALRITLHALRDRLTPEEASQLGAQLPMLIRGLYYEAGHQPGSQTRYGIKRPFWLLFVTISRMIGTWSRRKSRV